MTHYQAQLLANKGYTVIESHIVPDGHGHLATVSADGKFNTETGPQINNIGAEKRTGPNKTAKESFGTEYPPKYYFDKYQFKQKNKENTYQSLRDNRVM